MTARISLLVLILSGFLIGTAGAAEARVALAPTIRLPADLPIYEDDSVNFYGTQIYLLEGPLLRQRAESQTGHPAPASLKIRAERVANTSILTITATGAEDEVAVPFLDALVEQFLRFDREQKKQFYRDAITRVDAALPAAPRGVAAQLEKHKSQLIMASLLDTEPRFRRLSEK
jgi:hypothetical protein